MDFGIHQFAYFFKQLKTSEKHRNPELSLSLNDFESFELLEFLSDVFCALYFSQTTTKIHTCNKLPLNATLSLLRYINLATDSLHELSLII